MKTIPDLIQESIAKGFDINISECPDYNDGQTFYITLERSGEDGIYETDRVNYSSPLMLGIEVEKAFEFLKSKIR